jgi:hypothetical protein
MSHIIPLKSSLGCARCARDFLSNLLEALHNRVAAPRGDTGAAAVTKAI